jgi:hypothetical protein
MESRVTIWKIKKDEIVTPDDLRLGRVDAGPMAGADAVANGVFTVPSQEIGGGSCCAVRVNAETCRRLMKDEFFSVEQSGWWSSFGSKHIVALRFPDGEKFEHIKGFMER